MAGVDVGEVVVRRAGGQRGAGDGRDRRACTLRSARARGRSRGPRRCSGRATSSVAPGPRDAAPIPDGGRMAAARVQPNVQLDEFLETFDSGTRKRVHSLFGGLARAVAGQSEALSDSLGTVAPLAGSLDQVLREVEDQRGELQSMVASSAGVLDALGSRAGLLQAAITCGQRGAVGHGAAQSRAARHDARAAAVPAPTARHVSHAHRRQPRPERRRRALWSRSLPSCCRRCARIDAAAPEFRALFKALPGVDHGRQAGVAGGKRDYQVGADRRSASSIRPLAS